MYVGIDLGTSGVKLVLCEKNGEVKKTVSREYPIYFPEDGYSEQNPSDWYDGVIDGLRCIAEGCGDKIRALSVSGQMHGLVMLDENDEVLRPAILWNDSRSTGECEYLNNEIGKEKLGELCANIAFPGFTAPKILWVRNNEREIFDRCKKIMLPKDYIVYRLTGEFVSEASDASGLLLFDVKNQCYSQEMLKICHISEDMLPVIKKSFEVCGKVRADICRDLSLGEVSVCPGGGDNACAAIGMGVLGNNMCSISLGTSGTVFITSESFKMDDNNALHSFVHADGNYHLMGCMLSAASCNKWFLEDILKSCDYTECESNKADGENNVFFLPYLMGERSPHNDPYARGVFAGMSLDTTRGDMQRAVMEGVCYALRDSVEIARAEGIKINSVRVCGGGSKSMLWLKMLADILRVNVEKTENSEGAGFGAAIIAMVGDGVYESLHEASDKIVKLKDTITYDEECAKKYDKGYEKFRKLYLCLKDWYRDEK